MAIDHGEAGESTELRRPEKRQGSEEDRDRRGVPQRTPRLATRAPRARAAAIACGAEPWSSGAITVVDDIGPCL
ncbi:MAG: hypothetical protein WDM88_11855 [Galbitalea sp.]